MMFQYFYKISLPFYAKCKWCFSSSDFDWMTIFRISISLSMDKAYTIRYERKVIETAYLF